MSDYVKIRNEMDLHDEMVSLEETKLLYIPENQFGIYQINPDGYGREYMFRSYDSLKEQEMEIRRKDYRLEYVAPLTEEDTLDTIYERFNLNHPEDFEGHSLSISDVVVMNTDGDVKAYFVDRFGFTDVTEEFLKSPKQQYRPLAKVEELEEQNYNMVDNVLNNGYGEKERREEIRMKAATYQEQTGASMTFYAAVCEEFHSMQACYEGLSLEEAVEKYKEIREDPRLAYYGNAMGVEIHDESLEEYDGYAFPLVEGSVIEGGNLDYVKELAIHPLAREAVERIREAFSEYRFVSPAEIKESIYPEHMTVDELARALLDLANEFDAYDFMDQVESPETALTEIKYNLLAGLGMQEYASFLKDVKEESKELAPRAEALRDRLREYTPELTDEIQPMIKIRFSQDSNIKEGSMFSLTEADEAFRESDKS